MKLLRTLVLGALGLVLPLSAHADTIKIGLMCPLTGGWASEGLDMKQIVGLLTDEVNKAGGINGKQLELIVEDDRGARRAETGHCGSVGRDRHLRLRCYGSGPEYSGRI